MGKPLRPVQVLTWRALDASTLPPAGVFRKAQIIRRGSAWVCAGAPPPPVMLGAAVLKLNRGPGFKADPAGQGHDADRRPAAQATLAPEDLDEEV